MELFKLIGRVAVEGVEETKNQLSDITGQAESASGKMISAFKKIGTAVATYFAADKIIAFGKAVIDAGSSFDAAMSEVSAISGSTGDELASLRDKAREMGATTKFTATESANAFKYMAMAGWKTADMLNGIDGVLNLAAASGADLATTSDIVTDALTAMGYSAEDAGRLADVMAAAATNSNTNVEMMGETFKYAAAVAGSLGYSMEDTATAIGLMANAGIKSSQAGTALRSIMTRLATDAGGSSKKLGALGTLTETLGIAFYNTDGTARDFMDVIKDLREVWGQYDDEMQINLAKSIAGQEALSGFLAIVNASESDFNKLTNAISNANGAAEQMANTMIDNLTGDVTIAKSAFEGFQINLYEKFEPVLRMIVQAFIDFIENLSGTVDRIAEFVEWLNGASASATTMRTIIVSLTAAIAAWKASAVIQSVVQGFQSAQVALSLLSLQAGNTNLAQAALNGTLTIGETIVGLLTGKIKLAALAQGLMTKAQAALNAVMNANPIAIVITVIAALVAAFIYLWKNCEGFRDFWIGLWEKIKDVFQKFVDWISPAIEAIKGFFVALGEKISDVWNSVMKSLEPLINEIKGAFEEAWEVIKAIWDYVEPYFKGVWENIKSIFSVVKEVLGANFKNAWEYIKLIWSVAVDFFKTLWENIKAVFAVVKEILGGFFRTAWEAIKAIWNGVVAYFELVWAGIKAIFAVVKGVLTGDFSDAWEAIKNVWDKAKNYFSTVWNGIKNVFASVKKWFGNTFSAAWEAVKKVFSNWGSFFGGLWDKIKNTFSKIGTNISEAIGQSVKAGINGVISAIEGTINTGINLINGAIGLINLIPGVNIGEIERVDFPRLAKGGIVSRATIAQIGEDGAEAIVPLERNTQWIDAIVSKISDKTQNVEVVSVLEAIIDIMEEMLSIVRAGQTIVIDKREFGRTVRELA